VDWRDSSRHQATFRAEAGSWQRVITDFLRRTGNLKLAQMLAGHADIDDREHLRPSRYNRPQDRATGAERRRHMTYRNCSDRNVPFTWIMEAAGSNGANFRVLKRMS
jgi:hypothetical protein